MSDTAPLAGIPQPLAYVIACCVMQAEGWKLEPRHGAACWGHPTRRPRTWHTDEEMIEIQRRKKERADRKRAKREGVQHA